MPRLMLTDKRWEMLLHLMKSTGRMYNKPAYRMTFESILYRLRTGTQWRDLPEEFGSWSTLFSRFNFWSKKGILSYIFKLLARNADFERIRKINAMNCTIQSFSNTAYRSRQKLFCFLLKLT